MNLTADLGDSKTFTIPMRWGNRAFVPGEVDWGLIFTVKADADTEDSEALLQASGPGTGLNLEVSGSNALITIQRADTYSVVDDVVTQAAPGTYYWDIQAVGIDGEAHEGKCQTVAHGTFVLGRDITRGSNPTIPVFTTEEPVFQGPPGPTGASGTIESMTVTTGAAGSSASVTLGGTASARTIALTVPRGDAGVQGPPGDNIIVSATEPVSPEDAQGWFDSTTGILAFWSDDADAWVGAISSIIPAGAWCNPSGVPYISPTGEYYISQAA